MASLVSFYENAPVEAKPNAPALNIEQLPLADAAGFQLVNPEPGLAYVRHPLRPQRLLPLASYHPDLVIEKANDAISLLTALGASRIELGYSSRVSGEAKADVEAVFGLVRFQTTVSKGQNMNIIYSAKGDGSDPRPLPPLVWLDQPAWQGIVGGRLYGGLREFALSFTYEQRTDIDADLNVAVKKFGLRAGGGFHKAHKVDFSLRGEFPPLAAGRRR